MAVEREWVSIRDPHDDHLRYTFDVSFLLSTYRCIYGDGCRGIRSSGPDPTVGCCEHGAYLTEDHEAAQLRHAVEHLLTPASMEHHAEAVRDGFLEEDEDGELLTRRVGEACIFLNGPGFPGGTGCAFHHLAVGRGEHPMTHKPIVCWQLPLHRTIAEEVADDGEVLHVHTIAAFERGTWGEGGSDFHWWCTEDPDAFRGGPPVYLTMEHELRAMVGDAVYAELARFLADRSAQTPRVRFLPIAGG